MSVADAGLGLGVPMVSEAGRVTISPPAPIPRRIVRPALEGQLGQIGLPTVLLVLEMERKSGVLRVVGPTAIAELALRRGRIVRARLAGNVANAQGTTQGTTIVYQALTWTQGSFEFHASDIDGPDEIQASTTFLLMEAARRQDEANQAKKPPPGNASL